MLNRVIAICGSWYLEEVFADDGFLEKDLRREGSQIAQRRNILSGLRPKPHPICPGFQTSVQLEPT